MKNGVKLNGNYKNYIFIIFLIIFLFANIFLFADDFINVNNNEIIYNSIYEQFLRENNIPINYIDEKYFVDENIEETDLIRFLELLILSANVIADNIANVNTTRTSEGGPFIRNKIIIIGGQIKIIKDENSTVKLVYDPAHPDSIKDGEGSGYVQYPNVDIVSEMMDLITVSRIYENIIEECNIKKINIPEKYFAPIKTP